MGGAEVDLGQAAAPQALDVPTAGARDGAADTDPHALPAAAGAVDGIAGILGGAQIRDGAGPGVDVDPWLGVPAGHVVDGDDAFVIVGGVDTAGAAAPDAAVHVPQDVELAGAALVDVEGRAGAVAAVPSGQDVPLAVDGALGVEAHGALGVVAALAVGQVHHDPAAQRRVAVELPAPPGAGQVARLPGPGAEDEPAPQALPGRGDGGLLGGGKALTTGQVQLDHVPVGQPPHRQALDQSVARRRVGPGDLGVQPGRGLLELGVAVAHRHQVGDRGQLAPGDQAGGQGGVAADDADLDPPAVGRVEPQIAVAVAQRPLQLPGHLHGRLLPAHAPLSLTDRDAEVGSQGGDRRVGRVGQV